VISGVGYFFGRHWDKLERGMKRFDVVVAVVVVAIAVFLWWRGRRAERN
jgi:membrane protein DedA with SNARE-associated domain